jgi:hypothetical protein
MFTVHQDGFGEAYAYHCCGIERHGEVVPRRRRSGTKEAWALEIGALRVVVVSYS